MPAKPSAAALRNASSGNSSRSSQPGPYGSHSSRANSRAVSWNARCSSERSKSMPGDYGAARRRGNGLVLLNPLRWFTGRLAMVGSRESLSGENDAENGTDLRCCRGAAGRAGGGAEKRRDAQILSPRQPGEHVDPRGGDDLDRGADLGGVQQPDPLQAGRKDKPAGVHRAGAGGKLVVEPGLHATDLQAAPGRQVA